MAFWRLAFHNGGRYQTSALRLQLSRFRCPCGFVELLSIRIAAILPSVVIPKKSAYALAVRSRQDEQTQGGGRRGLGTAEAPPLLSVAILRWRANIWSSPSITKNIESPTAPLLASFSPQALLAHDPDASHL